MITIDPKGVRPKAFFYLVYACAILASQLIGYLTFYGVDAASVIWPCAGVYGAALVISHQRHWWMLILIMVFIDQMLFLIQRDMYAGRAEQIVMFVKLLYNPTIGVIFALIVRRFVPERNPVGGLRSLAIYAALAIFANLMLTSIVSWSIASLVVSEIGLIARWQQWSYSGISGLLAYGTPIILIANHWGETKPAVTYRWDSILYRVVFTGVCVFLFAFDHNQKFFLLYQFLILLPLFAWVIARYGPTMLTLSSCVLVTVIIVGMSLGRGPFHHPDRPEFENVLGVQGVIVPGMLALFFIASLLESIRLQYEQQLENESRLQRLNRFETLGTMAGGVAHDFGNFAIALRSYKSVLSSQIKERSKVTNDALNGLEEIASSAQSMTRALMNYARDEIDQPDEVVRADLCRAAASCVAAIRPVASSAAQINAKIPDEPLMVGVSTTDLKRMLTNLILNALDASPNNTPVHVSVQSDHTNAMLIVEDYGEGMTREVQERIFDPYYTTKTKGKGTGLGLSVVAGIVYELKGTINVMSTPGNGTTITMKLPLLNDHPDASSTSDDS